MENKMIAAGAGVVTIVVGILTAYSMGYGPTTENRLTEVLKQQAEIDAREKARQAEIDAVQDIKITLAELRNIRAKLLDVNYELQTHPDDQALLREKDDLEFETKLLENDLAILKQKIKGE